MVGIRLLFEIPGLSKKMRGAQKKRRLWRGSVPRDKTHAHTPKMEKKASRRGALLKFARWEKKGGGIFWRRGKRVRA